MTKNIKQATDFDTFVRQQQAAAHERTIDWNQERNEWLRRLDDLYATVELHLKKYVDASEIKIKYDSISLNEENIGSYSARRLTLSIGRKKVTLTPIGTFLIGAKGRVDVVGPAGSTRLMLVDSKSSGPKLAVRILTGKELADTEEWASKSKQKEIDWAWKIVTSPPSVQYLEFTREAFFQALMEVANG